MSCNIDRNSGVDNMATPLLIKSGSIILTESTCVQREAVQKAEALAGEQDSLQVEVQSLKAELANLKQQLADLQACLLCHIASASSAITCSNCLHD